MDTQGSTHLHRVQGFGAVESRVSVYSNIGTVVTARIKTQEFRRLLKHAIGEHALRYIRVTVTLNRIGPIRMTLSEPASLKSFHLELRGSQFTGKKVAASKLRSLLGSLNNCS